MGNENNWREVYKLAANGDKSPIGGHFSFALRNLAENFDTCDTKRDLNDWYEMLLIGASDLGIDLSRHTFIDLGAGPDGNAHSFDFCNQEVGGLIGYNHVPSNIALDLGYAEKNVATFMAETQPEVLSVAADVLELPISKNEPNLSFVISSVVNYLDPIVFADYLMSFGQLGSIWFANIDNAGKHKYPNIHKDFYPPRSNHDVFVERILASGKFELVAHEVNRRFGEEYGTPILEEAFVAVRKDSEVGQLIAASLKYGLGDVD